MASSIFQFVEAFIAFPSTCELSTTMCSLSCSRTISIHAVFYSTTALCFAVKMQPNMRPKTELALTGPATLDILNSELTNCPRTAAVLGDFSTQWQQMVGDSAASRTRDCDIAEPGHRYREHAQDTDRYNGKSTATEGRRATLSEEPVGQHITRRVRAREIAGWLRYVDPKPEAVKLMQQITKEDPQGDRGVD